MLLEALADVDCNVIATVGPSRDPAELAPFPDNAHVERYISQSLVLPLASVAVVHGGSGSTLAALAHGLPLLVVPQAADQFENAQQCVAIGDIIREDGARRCCSRGRAAGEGSAARPEDR